MKSDEWKTSVMHSLLSYLLHDQHDHREWSRREQKEKEREEKCEEKKLNGVSGRKMSLMEVD